MARTFVTFDTTFPDDPLFDEAGEMKVPGGRRVAELIVAALRSSGVKVTDPEQHSWYGWRFMLSTGDGVFRFILQNPDRWLLFVSREPTFFERFSIGEIETGLPDVLGRIAEIINGDNRFQSPAWFTREEYEKNKQVGLAAP